MLPSRSVQDRLRLADTVSPRVNTSPLKDRPSLVTAAPWHYNQAFLLPILLFFACHVPYGIPQSCNCPPPFALRDVRLLLAQAFRGGGR